ncbi:LRP2-binding protein-like isoform X1 [Lytechinus variegatus]|uniref:LRP2-binding protein-like isoform X1 n=1 Tax=Lytechinus variegatus TaxID=7654 RepID=UPI001BB14642|nr:LRP2-binding protein-like isoform X1 [Lytechinus variegatus]
MEHQLTRQNTLPAEPLPGTKSFRSGSVGSLGTELTAGTKSLHILDDAERKDKEEQELNEKVEALLLDKVKKGDKVATFQLGQFYFEQERYKEAKKYFYDIRENDLQAQYQLGIIYFDGLGTDKDMKRGFEYMKGVADSDAKWAQHLIPCAQYNIGRAYYEGCGVKQSDSEAERYWILAADDGNPKASIKAQTALGMFYCRDETKDLKKAFFWHSEATGNGSLESQGALGILYATGQGCKKDVDSAFECLKESAERGNVYSMGHLVAHYYSTKLYTKAAELAARLSQVDNFQEISKATDCLPVFLAKGVAMGCFYYARCLHLGHGVKKDKDLAQHYYSRAFQFDGGTTQRLQNMVTHGQI